MPRWQFFVEDDTGSYELTEASARTATWRRRSGHDAALTIDGRHEQAVGVHELRTDLHVLRDGRRLYRGRIAPSTDTIEKDSHSTRLAASSYRSLLEGRLLWGDLPSTGTAYGTLDESDIAWAIVQHLQAQTGGSWGIARGVGAVTGVTRTGDKFAAGIAARQAFSQIADGDQGFDWDVNPDPDPNVAGLTFDVYYPSRGADNGEPFHFGGNVDKVVRTIDPRLYANALRETGATGLLPELREVAGLATAPEGRWDAQVGRVDVTVQAALAALADRQIAVSAFLRPSYVITLAVDAWGGPDHVWIGDTAHLYVDSGRVQVADEPLLVEQIDATVGGDSDETIALTLGAPPLELVDSLKQMIYRLSGLEHR